MKNILSNVKTKREISTNFVAFLEYINFNRQIRMRFQKDLHPIVYDGYSPKWVFIDSLPTSLHHLSKCETRKSSSRCAFIHIELTNWSFVQKSQRSGFIFELKIFCLGFKTSKTILIRLSLKSALIFFMFWFEWLVEIFCENLCFFKSFFETKLKYCYSPGSFMNKYFLLNPLCICRAPAGIDQPY